MLAIKQLTEEQRLTKAVVSIMSSPKYVALAGVLMIGERSVVDDPSVPTACTNGRDEFYGREFVSKLNDAELRFLVLHEVYHKLFRHLTTWKHLYMQDAYLANVSCDYVINLKIVDDNYEDGFATMTGELAKGCYDRKYVGMDTAQVFHLLRKDQPQGGGGRGGIIVIGDPEDGDGTPQNGSGSLPDGQEPFDAHDWEGAQEMTADEQRDLAREIDEAVRQGALVAGKMGSGGDRDLEALLEPQVDWREVLREFVQTTCTGSDYSTYRRPNRRYLSSGIYMPSGVSEQVGELVVAIDTSGSIGQEEVTAFLSEVKGICDTVHPDKVRLLYWDTKICRDETYDMHELDTLVQSTKPKGGGGTDVECVTEYIREESITAQACIVITDGDLYSGWGQWTMPVLWCVIDNKHKVPDVGKCVHIKSRDM
jgi:predicted metal-dependent peptidase